MKMLRWPNTTFDAAWLLALSRASSSYGFLAIAVLLLLVGAPQISGMLRQWRMRAARLRCLYERPPRRGSRRGAAVGGSGTRVLAAIVRQSGMWIGANLNGPLDALDLADYCAQWIPTYVGAAGPLSPTVIHQMRQGLSDVVEKHRAPLNDATAPWGWKNSGSLHLLRLVHDTFPDARFVHMVRDGRDMAYSPNQYQVRRYGDLLLTPEERRWSQPLRSIVVWSRLNLMAADYADQYLPDRYRLVRSKTCVRRRFTVQRVLDFCGLNGTQSASRDQVVAPSSIGRWQHQTQQPSQDWARSLEWRCNVSLLWGWPFDESDRANASEAHHGVREA
jgi:hypothetical protein